jgi:hypothetical protein
MANDAYELDPDVAVIRKRMPVNMPKSSMYGKNPELQPDAEYSYETDPDITSISNRKVTPAEKPEPGGYLPLFLKGAGEAALHSIAGIVSAPVSAAAGIYGTLTSGKYGTPEGIKAGQETAKRVQQAMLNAGTQPETEEGKSYLESLQKAFEASKIPPVVPEIGGLTAETQMAGKGVQTAKQALNAQFQKIRPKVTIETAPGLRSAGAAATETPAMIQGNIDAALANASPELQAHINAQEPTNVNVPALETRALEEKHGVNLTTGQRSGDTSKYSEEWNRRGETEDLTNHFKDQPVQLANAFEKAKVRHAADIPSTADASELGQHEINALSEKDAIRKANISSAYKALQDQNGGQFPIDIGALDANIKNSLAKNLKTNHLSDAVRNDLKDFYQNPTFESYEAMRTNLANEMRSSSNGNARGAAYIVRQELENLPVFGENTGTPEAMQLKALADKARSLVVERSNVIKANPAYKAAIKEAADLNETAAQGESLNAANFHKKYVASATPEAIRRMRSEIDPEHIANQAITFAELDRAKNAITNPNATSVKANSFANFMQKEAPKLKESLPPEAMKDVMEIGLLSSKIGKPEAGTFNYSNTYSSLIGDLAKQGLAGAAEMKLAGLTSGASVPVVSLGKAILQKRTKDAFAKAAIDPKGGLTKEEK